MRLFVQGFKKLKLFGFQINSLQKGKQYSKLLTVATSVWDYGIFFLLFVGNLEKH